MRLIGKLAFASASLLALTTPVFAQDTVAGDSAAQGVDEGAAGGEDIVVTARRRDENVQDVPLVVNAVTSESLAKLNIREFQDVASLVPGLSLGSSAIGIGTQASLRGVSYDVTASGNNGTIEFYVNDAPTSSAIVFQSLFDVTQIEVLRGPQGTLRGRASPSGSITVTTHRPDLNEVGGYINMTGTTLSAINVNAAVGVPIIKDVLALRVAGVYEENDGNRVHSINNGINPFVKTKGARASLRFDPTQSLSFNASYTKTVRDVLQFDQVESANLAQSGLPASPTLIRAEDRLAVAVRPRTYRQDFEVFNWQGEYRFAGQKLNYVGSHNTQRYTSVDPNDKGLAFASPPFVPALALGAQTTNTVSTQETHELRLSSDDRLFGMVDYVVGGLINKANSPTVLNTQTPIFVGAFVPVAYAALVNTPVVRSGKMLERSLFGNLTVHIGEGTEISGGLRYINYTESASLAVAGLDVPAGRRTGDAQNTWIYSASLKHRFSDSFMVYANFGTSWRPGGTTNAIVDRNNQYKSPQLERYLFPAAEKSKSYEIGFKSDWFDRRLKLNVTGYLQNFENFAYSSPNVYAISTTDPTNNNANARSVSIFTPAFAVGVPVQVKGVEAELAWNTDHFSAGATVSYSLAKIKNGVIPCNVYGGNVPTVADIEAASGGETFALCTVNSRAGTLPPFSATLQAEYNMALSGRVDGYLRGLTSIFGASQNDPGNPLDNVSAYALVNLFAGIRDPDGMWDVGFFVKNLFDTTRVLSRNDSPYSAPYQLINPIGTPIGSGSAVSTYRGITMTPPREFGLNVKYSFGAR